MSADTIVVVGAGPSGTRAAETLVRAGLRPVVIDEAPASGGQIYRRQPPGFARAPGSLYGFEAAKARAVHAAFDALKDKVDYRLDTLVWEIREGKVQAIANRDNRRAEIAYGALILATGAMDRIVPFPGWTLPGVVTAGGAQAMLKGGLVVSGRTAVVAGTGPLLLPVATGAVPLAATERSTGRRWNFACSRR